MAGFDPKVNTGSFVATTNVWDVGQLLEADVNSEEFKLLLVRLYQNINNISLVLNGKETGFHLLEEFVTGQQWFNINNDNNQLRPNYRLVVNTGALGAGLNQTPHGLTPTNTWTFTRISGAASDTTTLTYVPLPHANGGATDIIVTVDATFVNITNNSGAAFTNSYIILEYLKF